MFDVGSYTVVLADHAKQVPEALTRVPENKRPDGSCCRGASASHSRGRVGTPHGSRRVQKSEATRPLAAAYGANSHGHRCVGWEVICPDGIRRHYPYHNEDDAKDHADLASDASWFAKRGCRLAPKPSPLELSKPPCPGGHHEARAMMLEHASVERGEA